MTLEKKVVRQKKGRAYNFLGRMVAESRRGGTGVAAGQNCPTVGKNGKS